ncbi:MAG: flagellar FlbD family protein [Bdellovibrionota bacterium]
MIKLTRIQGEEIYVNEDNIQWIECNPDSTITLLNGNRFIVKENISQILELIKNNTLPQAEPQ